VKEDEGAVVAVLGLSAEPEAKAKDEREDSPH
jgi:hypothetical protein